MIHFPHFPHTWDKLLSDEDVEALLGELRIQEQAEIKIIVQKLCIWRYHENMMENHLVITMLLTGLYCLSRSMERDGGKRGEERWRRGRRKRKKKKCKSKKEGLWMIQYTTFIIECFFQILLHSIPFKQPCPSPGPNTSTHHLMWYWWRRYRDLLLNVLRSDLGLRLLLMLVGSSLCLELAHLVHLS